MRVNSHFGLNGMNRIPMSNSFRGPGSNHMGNIGGANQAVEQRLLETVTFLSVGETRAGRLSEALSGISGAFTPRVAVSGDPARLQVTSFSGTNISDTKIRIHQVATTQRNEGTALVRATPVETSGLKEFEIEVDGNVRRLSFTVAEGATQEQFQQQMAAAINGANLGITATVSAQGNNSRLSIETGTTGQGMDGEPRFSIRDVEDGGGAVALTGVAEITQEAQGAIFSVNGGEKQNSATNRIDLGNGLVVNLVKASNEPVSVFMGTDRVSMQNSVRNVVNMYNSLLEAAHVNSADRNTRNLIRELQNAARFSRRDLERVGIRIERDGTLSINERVFNEATENGALERFFRGNNGRPNDFVARLTRISESVASNPMRYVSPHAGRLPGFNAAMAALNNPPPQQGQGASAVENAYLPDDPWSFLDALQ